LQLKDVEKIFADLYHFGIRYVFLAGGEPLLRPDLTEVMQALADIGFSTELVTNGILLDEEMINAVTGVKNSQIVVSLDSLRSELYEVIRGVNQLDKVILGIKTLANVSHARKYPARINMTVNSLNYREIDSMIQFCNFLKLQFSAYPYNSAGRGRFMSDDSLLSLNRQRDKIAEAFNALSKKCAQEKCIFGFSSVYEKISDFVRGEYIGPCGAGRDHLVVGPEGDVSVCEEFAPFGCLKENAIHEIYKPEKWVEQVKLCYTNSPCFLGCSRVLTLMKSRPAKFAWDLLSSRKLPEYFFHLR